MRVYDTFSKFYQEKEVSVKIRITVYQFTNMAVRTEYEQDSKEVKSKRQR